MTGLTNYTAVQELYWLTGQEPQIALPTVWLALFTGVGTDAGTGFTEVSGGAYARVQVSGTLAAGAAFTTATATITLASAAPAWLLALGTNGSGVSVYDQTIGGLAAAAFLGTVSSVSGSTVTLTANSLHASSGSADSLVFSAFAAPTGSAPSQVQNGAAITFAQATLSWGTVIAFGLYDASSSGNLLSWDFLGNFSWLPFEIPTASNLATVKANGMASNDPIVLTTEYGGTFPTLSTGTFTGYTVNYVATPATDTINIDTTSGPATPVVTTSSGSGMLRKIVQQSIPANVTASFAANAMTITAA